MISVTNDGLPDDLLPLQPLWETLRPATPTRSESITRLYDDGRLYTWSDTRRRMVNGRLQREAAPYAWRLDAQIRPEGVDQVRELIRAGFMQLDERNAARKGFDQGIVVRRSNVDGVEHSVTFPASATSALPQVIRDIDYAINANIESGAVPLDQ